MSWHWQLRRDHEGTFWDIVEDNHKYGLGRNVVFYLHDHDLDEPLPERYPAHEIIKTTKKLFPIQARLYRLVYGSLP